MAKSENLQSQTITGLLWTGAELVGNQGIRFIIQIFLARLLAPADFGVIGMITVFITISTSLIDSGFQNALIREKTVSPAACSTVFIFNILCAGLLYIILYVSAPWIAQFYTTPVLTAVIRVVSIMIVIDSFSLISRTLLTRQLAFKIQMVINIVSSVGAGGLAIAMALSGYGVWSIVWQMLVAQFLQTVGFLWAAKWQPRLQFSLAEFSHLFQFGWKLTASGLVYTLYNNLMYVVIGRFYSVSTLGYFTNAGKISRLLTDTTTTAIQKVSYPVLSKIQHDKTALQQGYRRVILQAIYLVFPLSVGVGVLAKPIIVLILGKQWLPAVPFLLPLCLTGMFFPLQALNLNILQVLGRSDLFLRLEILKKVSGIVVFIGVFLFHLDIMLLIWLLVVQEFFCYVLDSTYAGKFLQYGTIAQLKDSRHIFLAVGIMGGVVKVVTILLPAISWLNLLLSILVGIAVYLLSSYFLHIKQLASFWKILQQITLPVRLRLRSVK